MKLPKIYIAYVVIAVIVVAIGYTYHRASANAQKETRMSILNHSVEAIDSASITQDQKDAIFSSLFVDVPPVASLKFPFTLGLGKSDAAGPGQGRKGPRPGPGASSNAPTCPTFMKSACKEINRMVGAASKRCFDGMARQIRKGGELEDSCSEDDKRIMDPVGEAGQFQQNCQSAGCI